MLWERVAAAADAIADDLAQRFGMAAWDRIRLIGQIQRQLVTLREQRFRSLGGPPVIVTERRDQPLECVEPVWSFLRQGRRVFLQLEPGADGPVIDVMRSMAEVIGQSQLVLGGAPPAAESGGVAPAGPRVAIVQGDADLETAAYVLARACLRRTGFDPRSVHRVIAVTPLPRLERHLRRLWLGARMGPPDDPHAFAGPVVDAQASSFMAAIAAWRAYPGVTTVCDGGRLLRPDSGPGQRYLAPALMRLDVAEGVAGPAVAGPLLVLEHVAEDDEAERRAAHLAPRADRGTVMRFGIPRKGIALRPLDRQIRGALLVERLPPGLPEPRP